MMLRNVARFASIRVKWLICFACFTAGWLACFAWVMTCLYAPQVAVSVIDKVH